MLTGMVINLVTVSAAARQTQKETGSALISLNAVSHWIWGGRAAYRQKLSAKYTLTGFVIHHFASLFWGLIFERFWGHAAEYSSIRRAYAGACAIAAASYVVDYWIAPKRLTPGWDLRLSQYALGSIYTSIALSLPLRGLLWRIRRHDSIARS